MIGERLIGKKQYASIAEAFADPAPWDNTFGVVATESGPLGDHGNYRAVSLTDGRVGLIADIVTVDTQQASYTYTPDVSLANVPGAVKIQRASMGIVGSIWLPPSFNIYTAPPPTVQTFLHVKTDLIAGGPVGTAVLAIGGALAGAAAAGLFAGSSGAAAAAAPASSGALIESAPLAAAAPAAAATPAAWAPSLAATTFSTAMPAAAAASEAATLAAAGLTAVEMADLGLSASAIASVPGLTQVTNLPTGSQASAPQVTQSPSISVPPDSGATNMTGFYNDPFAATPTDYGLGFDPFTSSPEWADFTLTSSTGGIPLETFGDLGLGGMTATGELTSGGLTLSGIGSSLSDIFGSIGSSIKAGAGALLTGIQAKNALTQARNGTGTATPTRTVVSPRPGASLGSSNLLSIALLIGAAWFALKG